MVADKRGYTITISYTSHQRVTIEVIDNITFLVVAAFFAFFVGYIAVFNMTQAISFGFAGGQINRCEFITTIRSYIIIIDIRQRAVYIAGPFVNVAAHII